VKFEVSAKFPTCWRMPSSGMWHRVDIVWTDVSEERSASIFRVQKFSTEEPAWGGGCTLQPPAHAGSSSGMFLSWRWRRYVSQKHRFTQDLYGSTSQKTTFFIVTAVKTSNSYMFMELEDILLCPQEPTSGPCTEPHKSSPHFPNIFN
jgi:hypothetical protein